MSDDEAAGGEEKSLGEVVSTIFGEMGRRMSSLGAAMQQQEAETVDVSSANNTKAPPSGGESESTVVALLAEIRDLLRQIADHLGGG
jgi:hypothetical protein